MKCSDYARSTTEVHRDKYKCSRTNDSEANSKKVSVPQTCTRYQLVPEEVIVESGMEHHCSKPRAPNRIDGNSTGMCVESLRYGMEVALPLDSEGRGAGLRVWD
jgi:hypothetical protein